MLVNYKYCREIISRVKSPLITSSSTPSNRLANGSEHSLAGCMSYGLGSGPNGRAVSGLRCSNRGACQQNGLMACAQCSLVSYCSGHCQRQHWPKHRLDCGHPYLNPSWEPEWVTQNREPLFSDYQQSLPPSSSSDVYKNPGYPAYDCLQLETNEGAEGLNRDIRICMTAAGDIRNIVETVNGLPAGYTGKLDILANNSNTLVLNRMLVILCALLTPGPSVDESAELAMHLMYSACLPETAAAYARYIANLIYREDGNTASRKRDMAFQASLKTRGRGRLHCAQPAAGVKRPMEMWTATQYSVGKAMKSMKRTFEDPFYLDDREKILSALKPSHRMALSQFWKTGVLAPFSMDLATFNSPNRLMFTPQGEWIGGTSAYANPLHGWDVSAVIRTGTQHGIDPNDILGCLFFHIKSTFHTFVLRVKELNVHIHLCSYDTRLLSKGISIGVLPAFEEAGFDRIDAGDLGDSIGVGECLADWAPLLNKQNESAGFIMHSKKWHEGVAGAIARNNPRAVRALMDRCGKMPDLKSKLATFFRGAQDPSLVRLMSSLDAFVDHEDAFLRYLESQDAEATASSLGISLRGIHSINSKRVGVPLHAIRQRLPNLSKDEFYNLFTLGGSDLAMRFVESESAILHRLSSGS